MGIMSWTTDNAAARTAVGLWNLGVPQHLAVVFADVCFRPPGKRIMQQCVIDRDHALQAVVTLEEQLKGLGSRRDALTEVGWQYVLRVAWRLFGPYGGQNVAARYLPEVEESVRRGGDRAGSNLRQAALEEFSRVTSGTLLAKVQGGTGGSFMLDAALYEGTGPGQKIAQQEVLCAPDLLAFFAPGALDSGPLMGRAPLVLEREDWKSCVIGLPEDMYGFESRGDFHCQPSRDGDFYLDLHTERHGLKQIYVQYRNSLGQVKEDLRTNLTALASRMQEALGGPTNLERAIRYLGPDHPYFDLDEEAFWYFMLPTEAFRMIDGKETTWQGFFLCAPDQIAFLEPEDLSARDTEGRSPTIVRHDEFESCTFALPESFSFPELAFISHSYIRMARSTDDNGYMFLTVKGRGSLNFRFKQEDLSESQMETRNYLKDLIVITDLAFRPPLP